MARVFAGAFLASSCFNFFGMTTAMATSLQAAKKERHIVSWTPEVWLCLIYLSFDVSMSFLFLVYKLI